MLPICYFNIKWFTFFVSFQWNDVILTFRSGMSVGRHRRYMKSYDSCFIASESIDWLHEELKNNPNFGPKVTRWDWLLWVLHGVCLSQKFFPLRKNKNIGEHRHSISLYMHININDTKMPVKEIWNSLECLSKPGLTLQN